MMLDYIAALLRRIWKGLTDGSQATKITDGTETLAIDATSNAARATIYSTAGNAVDVRLPNADGQATNTFGLLSNNRHYLFNGATWDRARGDITNGLDVDVTRLPGQVTYEGSNSISTVSGHKQSYNVHLDVQNASGTVGYMLIDLSDTTNWKHTATGHIVVEKIIINVNPSSAYLGDIEIGFLSSVDATDGDFNKIIVVHDERSAVGSTEIYDFSGIGLDLETTNWFGPVTANDTTWQTDVNLYGPSGATSFPAGAGDLVMKLISTAGNVDIGVTIVYNTVA